MPLFSTSCVLSCCVVSVCVKWLYVYAIVTYLFLHIDNASPWNFLFQFLQYSLSSSLFCAPCSTFVTILFPLVSSLLFFYCCSLLWSGLQNALMLLYTPLDLICTLHNPPPWFCNVNCDWANSFSVKTVLICEFIASNSHTKFKQRLTVGALIMPCSKNNYLWNVTQE